MIHGEHTCTGSMCPVCKVDHWNAAEWTQEATETQHRFRCDDARADYVADNYERDE